MSRHFVHIPLLSNLLLKSIETISPCIVYWMKRERVDEFIRSTFKIHRRRCAAARVTRASARAESFDLLLSSQRDTCVRVCMKRGCRLNGLLALGTTCVISRGPRGVTFRFFRAHERRVFFFRESMCNVVFFWGSIGWAILAGCGDEGWVVLKIVGDKMRNGLWEGTC